MRFNLKDLMWSVTFAGLGFACFGMVPKITEWRESYPYFFNLAGFLFGAAVGKLFHRMLMGVVCGSILFIVFANLISTAHDYTKGMEENPYKAPDGDLLPLKPDALKSPIGDALAILGVVLLILAALMSLGVSQRIIMILVTLVCVGLGCIAWWHNEFRRRSKWRSARHKKANEQPWLPVEPDPPDSKP